MEQKEQSEMGGIWAISAVAAAAGGNGAAVGSLAAAGDAMIAAAVHMYTCWTEQHVWLRCGADGCLQASS
jgi:hypothetical protein